MHGETRQVGGRVGLSEARAPPWTRWGRRPQTPIPKESLGERRSRAALMGSGASGPSGSRAEPWPFPQLCATPTIPLSLNNMKLLEVCDPANCSVMLDDPLPTVSLSVAELKLYVVVAVPV